MEPAGETLSLRVASHSPREWILLAARAVMEGDVQNCWKLGCLCTWRWLKWLMTISSGSQLVHQLILMQFFSNRTGHHCQVIVLLLELELFFFLSFSIFHSLPDGWGRICKCAPGFLFWLHSFFLLLVLSCLVLHWLFLWLLLCLHPIINLYWEWCLTTSWFLLTLFFVPLFHYCFFWLLSWGSCHMSVFKDDQLCIGSIEFYFPVLEPLFPICPDILAFVC